MATKLQELREEKGMTRQEVSKATGIPYNTLKRLEMRESDLVNLENLSTLATFYGQPLDVRHLLGVQ
jgi:transcriptional regulator with XRE-family HTH domain